MKRLKTGRRRSRSNRPSAPIQFEFQFTADLNSGTFPASTGAAVGVPARRASCTLPTTSSTDLVTTDSMNKTGSPTNKKNLPPTAFATELNAARGENNAMLTDEQEMGLFASPPVTMRKTRGTPAPPSETSVDSLSPPSITPWLDRSIPQSASRHSSGVEEDNLVLRRARSPFELHHKTPYSRNEELESPQSRNPFTDTDVTITSSKSCDSNDSCGSAGSRTSLNECIMAEAEDTTRSSGGRLQMEEENGTESPKEQRDFLNRNDSVAAFTGSPIREVDESYEAISSTAKTPAKFSGDSRISPTEISSFPFQDISAKGNGYKGGYDMSDCVVRRVTDASTPVKGQFAPSTPSKPRGVKLPSTPVVRTGVGSPYRPFLSRRRYEHNDNNFDSVQERGNSTAVSRFSSDFTIMEQIGTGAFGTVYKCLSKLDGCTYAVKAARRAARGNADRDRMLKEVYALAALSDLAETASIHIVRYHQAWMEENRLYIQTELCDRTLMHELSSGPMTERRRYTFLREILLALELIHRKGMVHLDIKPENIFIKNNQFKLGDFGLVSKLTALGDVEEGDSRYMSKELLAGQHDNLKKSDIFSLGATLYEICLGQSLPTDGEEWHQIRSGKFASLAGTPFEMKVIIGEMMNANPLLRPEAEELLQRRHLMSDEQKELIIARNKVTQANIALAAEKQRRLMALQPSNTKPARKLVRRTTWDVDMMTSVTLDS